MLLCSISLFAQRPPRGESDNPRHLMEKMKEFTPEQRAELESKRLTLSLDLNENQQQAVKTLSLEHGPKGNTKRLDREAKKNLSSDELYQMQSDRLDNKIAFKSGMKSILNKDQFAKWEELNADRRKQRGKSRRKGKNSKHPKKR